MIAIYKSVTSGTRRDVEAPRVLQISIQMVAVGLFAAFALIIYGHVISNALCCADDSCFAIVAKNLAFGKGYANSIALDGTPGLKLFDPAVGTGPTIILPAAGLIYLVGNRPWVPGFVTATGCLSLIAIIAVVLSRRGSLVMASAFMCTLILLLYDMTAGLHFEQWYAFLGELPAALLCVAGAVVLAGHSDERSAVITSGAMYGFAVMAKLLALLSFIPVVIWLVYRIISRQTERRRRTLDCFLAVIAFTVPFLAFELWKVIGLGWRQYVLNTKEYVSVVLAKSNGASTGPSGFSNMIARGLQTCSANAGILQNHFGYSPLTLLAVMVLVGCLIYRCARLPLVRSLYTLLAAGSLIGALWWLFISNGWPRYALIYLVLYFTAISCVVFIEQSRLMVGAVTILLLIVFSASYQRLMSPIRFVAANKFRYNSRVVNLAKTVTLLQGLRQDEPFVMGWWATAGDVEYSMPSVGNFVQSDHVRPSREDTGLILVRNKVWVTFGTTPEFAAWEQKCNKVLLDAPPYLISQCPEGSPRTEMAAPKASSPARN
jgi:hypothetical protein